jgi:A118 family predicted phage portal protein
MARWFWGQPTPPGQKRARLHMPLAGDIARTSSDLLFSEPPRLVSPSADAATQARLDELMDGPLRPTLLESGELCSALGGIVLTNVWDTTVADRPWIASHPADRAVPEWRAGHLAAVTLWTVVQQDGRTVWRHLERHEPGVILHGLYQGTPGQLGKAVPLNAVPATASYQPSVATGLPGLTASYIPNVRPSRGWRHVPGADCLGQSDFQGIEAVFDALDETYTSWMRDLRLGKGRVIVPASMLDSNGLGQGASWDEDREAYSPLNMLQRPSDSGKLDVVQFAIRVTDHRDTAAELMERAVTLAGYSGGTFGLQSGGQALTATEIRARNARSLTTRARKTLYWTPGLADRLAAQLQLEQQLFGVAGLTVEPPRIEWRDSIADAPAELAQTASLLRTAEAASTDTLVRLIHPDWDDPQVDAEVARIHAEPGRAPLPDPAALGAGGNGLDIGNGAG